MSIIQIMALRHSAFYSPLLMTMAGGYLKKEGLEYRYQIATPEVIVADSIRNGSCDVAQSAVATSFSVLESGLTNPFVHFAQINDRDGFFIASRKPQPDFSWSNLKHKKVLVDHFFQPLAMIKYGLHQKNIEFSDINVIDAGDVGAIEKAFLNGEADYAQMQGPVPQQLAYEGKAHVVATVGDLIGPVAFSSLCASPEWLASDEASAFMRAYQQASQFVINASAVEIAARVIEAGFFQGINVEVLENTILGYQALGCWRMETAIPRSSYEKLLDVFQFNELVTERYAYEALIVQPPIT